MVDKFFLFLFFEEAACCFPQWLIEFACLLAVYKGSLSSTLWSAFVAVASQLAGQNLNVVLICITPMAKNLEHFSNVY